MHKMIGSYVNALTKYFLVCIFGFLVLIVGALYVYFHYKYGLEIKNLFQLYYYISHNLLVIFIPLSLGSILVGRQYL